MRLEVSRIVDPETGEVHAAWLWGRETLCGVACPRDQWLPATTPHSAGVDCDECFRWFMAATVEEGASYMGRPMRSREGERV